MTRDNCDKVERDNPPVSTSMSAVDLSSVSMTWEEFMQEDTTDAFVVNFAPNHEPSVATFLSFVNQRTSTGASTSPFTKHIGAGRTWHRA